MKRLKKAWNNFGEVFDQAILRSLERAHAAALGYSYEEVWAMGITCAHAGLQVNEVMDIALESVRKTEVTEKEEV